MTLILARHKMGLEGLFNRVPGPMGVKVAVGTSAIMLFLAGTFFIPKGKGGGQNAFDVSRPESVQRSMDVAEEARLSRMLGSAKKEGRN